jgi:AmiR/NasT family two-component response regulator
VPVIASGGQHPNVPAGACGRQSGLRRNQRLPAVLVLAACQSRAASGEPTDANVPGFRYARLVSKIPFNVVIAEDEALIRLDLREMLEEEGYVVAGEAADGETAVQLAEQLHPDLVIMDVKMPGLDGISAAERITANQVAPVIILTAFSQRDLVQRASEAGAMAYLIKPFTKADLVPAIEVAVSRFAEIAALNAEAAGLRERLEVRKLLDRAKGALQDGQGMSEAQAFRWIQKTSMDRRQTMRAVAEEVLAEAEKAAANAGQAADAAPPAEDGKPAS